MTQINISLNAVGPLFIYLLLGWLLRRKKLLSPETIRQTNRLSYLLFLPATLFNNVISVDLAAEMPWYVIALAAGSSAISCLASVGIACASTKETHRRASLAQGMFRNNFVSYGIAIATSMYGSGAAALVSLLIAVVVPLNNIFAIVVLSLFNGKKPSLRRLLREVLLNPYVIASALGFLVLLTPVRLPSVVAKTVASLSGVGIPLSMMMLGATFAVADARSYRKEITVGCFTKLVLLPLLFVPIYILLGFRREPLLVLLIALCTPPAASSHVMAGQLGADQKLAGHLIVFASALSVLTIFLWLWILQMLGAL